MKGEEQRGKDRVWTTKEERKRDKKELREEEEDKKDRHEGKKRERERRVYVTMVMFYGNGLSSQIRMLEQRRAKQTLFSSAWWNRRLVV